MEALLKADGIDINSKESEHRTPLALAARKGHKECLQLLLAAGADIDTKNKWYALTGPDHQAPPCEATHAWTLTSP